MVTLNLLIWGLEPHHMQLHLIQGCSQGSTIHVQEGCLQKPSDQLYLKFEQSLETKTKQNNYPLVHSASRFYGLRRHDKNSNTIAALIQVLGSCKVYYRSLLYSRGPEHHSHFKSRKLCVKETPLYEPFPFKCTRQTRMLMRRIWLLSRWLQSGF